MKKHDDEAGEMIVEKKQSLPSLKDEAGSAEIRRRMRELTNKRSFHQLDNWELVQYIGWCHYLLSETYPEFRRIKGAQKKGFDAGKLKAEERKKNTLKIFSLMEAKGEKLPIKKAAIYSIFIKYWESEFGAAHKNNKDNHCPKEDTLFKIQREYLAKKGKP